jgi:hypothetical protein
MTQIVVRDEKAWLYDEGWVVALIADLGVVASFVCMTTESLGESNGRESNASTQWMFRSFVMVSSISRNPHTIEFERHSRTPETSNILSKPSCLMVTHSERFLPLMMSLTLNRRRKFTSGSRRAGKMRWLSELDSSVISQHKITLLLPLCVMSKHAYSVLGGWKS